MDSVIVKAQAKINLALEVKGKRPDGYHELCMIMQTLRLHDSLLIQKSEPGRLKLTCDQPSLPLDERNLAYQAAQYLIREYGLQEGVSISLRKKIPVSAGLAGGSSDCAAVLYGMNRLFQLEIPRTRLMEIGRRFGADVPFCLMRGTALAEGTGERLTRLPPHPKVWVVLAKPPVMVSTRSIFQQYDPTAAGTPPDIPAMIEALEKQNLPRIAALFGNALTGITARLHPIIGELITCMRRQGALNAAMSGSGPTVFGYFTHKETALSAIDEIKQAYPLVQELFLTGIYNTSAL